MFRLRMLAVKNSQKRFAPFRTAQRWVALYRKFGLAALARKDRADRGEHRAVSVKIKKAIEGLALQKPPLPITVVCRQARRMAQDLEDPAGLLHSR